MVKFLDHKKRQNDILDLIIEAYIKEGRPISSEYLKDNFNLSFSSATLRNIMSELENLGLVSHVHTSSGRIPTQEGLRYYVNFLMEEEKPEDLSSYIFDKNISYMAALDELMEEASRIISSLTHYAGFSFIREKRPRLFFWGTHFILEEPAFEDIGLLRNIFAALEEKRSPFRDFLESNLDKETKIFIGKEIGLNEINCCSLILSSLTSASNKKALLGILGPQRMNYSRGIAKLKAVKDYLEENFLSRL